MQDQENNHNPLEQDIVDGDNRTSVDGLLTEPTSNKKVGKKTTCFNLPQEASTTAANTANGGVEIMVNDTEKKSAIYGLSVIKNASSKFKRLASSAHTRRPDQPRFDRTKSAAVHALKGLKFISGKTDDNGAAWAAVAKRFDKLAAKTDRMLPRSRFGQCIGMDKENDQDFACELFDALARRKNISGDSITKEQLKEFWDQIADQSFDSRLETFFNMVDKNADGRISEDEVREIIALSASANKLTSIQKQADEYARLIMEELDTDNLGYIMIESLEMLLLRGASSQTVRASGPAINRNLSRMLSGKLKPTKERWHRNLEYFLEDNWRRVWVVALWIGAMAGLLAYKYVQYKNRAVFNVMGHCVCMAKGAAETLKLNMALILFPVCRNTITWLRNKTKLGVAVPFDDNLNFHKVIAIAIALGVGIHGISHLACDFPRLLNASPEKYEPMERFFGDQPTSYWFFVKGWEGVTGIVMVVLMAISFTLASPWFRRDKVKLPKPLDKLTGFNAFWYSHHLFIIVYALLIIHGIKLYLTHEWYKKTTWMYLAIPILFYAGERFIRTFRSNIKAVKIRKATVYHSATALHMTKPKGFEYRSGQYIFVKCADVSPFEWHPFSITSAPTDDYLSVHIRALGDWTKEIRSVFSKVCQPPPAGKTGIADFLQSEDNPNFPRLSIDGPYGAPTQDYKEYDVVLLVGLGIGATPMISVVKDIIYNITAIEKEENSLEEGARANAPPTSSSLGTKAGSGNGHHSFKIKKAYFYWVTREQDSFDWFKNVMNEVAEKNHNGVIEMHNYCTSVYEEGDARSALITMLQALNHAKNGVDVVSGTRVKSHFAKPDWKAVFNTIAFNHPNARVGVFYCGAPHPVKQLRHLSSDFSHRTSTKFEFHKENF